jgi:heme-degrading monooxygenase HmoA
MFVVIFRSTRTDENDLLYAEWSQRMSQAVTAIDGYISHVGFRDAQTREGVTIAYFETEEAIRTWREFPEHLAAQVLGRSSFYENYSVEVAEVVRAYRYPNT